MAELISTKPYMLRAIHEWCVDNGLTPYLLVAVNSQTRVPMAYVKNGEVVLNIDYGATKDLHIDNTSVVFSARFGGVSQNIYIPMTAVRGIYARENGQGLMFEPEPEVDEAQSEAQSMHVEEGNEPPDTAKKENNKKPTLRIVK